MALGRGTTQQRNGGGKEGNNFQGNVLLHYVSKIFAQKEKKISPILYEKNYNL